MNRRFRMISLNAEALSLELEDVLERDEKYENQFKIDFQEEIRYLMIKEADAVKARSTAHAPEIKFSAEDTIETAQPEQSPIMKEIYRSLARATHPDLHGKDTEEEFKEIQSAYTGRDLVKLIAAANRNNIAPEVDDEALAELEAMLVRHRAEIEEVKKTVRWQWGVSEKTEAVRTMVLASIGIIPTQFYSWKAAEAAQIRKKERERREAHEKKVREREAKARAERKERIKRSQSAGPNLTRLKDLERARRKAQKKSR